MTIQEENSKNTEVDYFKLTENEYQNVKSVSEYVYQLANNTLLETIQKEKWEEEDEKWIESRYYSTKPLWSNHRITHHAKGINLMRIDYAWDQKGNLKVLELNTSAQGGWVYHSILPELPYLETIGKPLTPPKRFLPNYLVNKLGERIVYLVSRKIACEEENDIIVKQIKSLGGDCLLLPFLPDDSDEMSEDRMNQLMQAIHEYQPTGIHMLFIPKIVDHADKLIQIANLNLPQSVSYESLFISGDKSFLQLLHKKDERNIIPKSFILDKSDLDKNLYLIEKDLAVLKPGDNAIGRDIQFGKNCDEDTWKQHIQKAMASDNYWIMQELCYLKRKNGKFEDLVCYIADGEVIAIGSRTSSNEIVNVYAGGNRRTAVIVSE
ncbi:unnamed protein product [Cunninghamella blakesleeana]